LGVEATACDGYSTGMPCRFSLWRALMSLLLSYTLAVAGLSAALSSAGHAAADAGLLDWCGDDVPRQTPAEGDHGPMACCLAGLGWEGGAPLHSAAEATPFFAVAPVETTLDAARHDARRFFGEHRPRAPPAM
jgi:hypothetical protein